MKIDQKTLDESWGLFVKYMSNNISNINKDKFIQVREKLQKQINEKGYADTNDPKLTEWWLKINKEVEKEMDERELIAGKFSDDVIKFHNYTQEFYEVALRIRTVSSFIDINKLRDYIMEQFEKIYESMRKIKTALDIE